MRQLIELYFKSCITVDVDGDAGLDGLQEATQAIERDVLSAMDSHGSHVVFDLSSWSIWPPEKPEPLKKWERQPKGCTCVWAIRPFVHIKDKSCPVHVGE